MSFKVINETSNKSIVSIQAGVPFNIDQAIYDFGCGLLERQQGEFIMVEASGLELDLVRQKMPSRAHKNKSEVYCSFTAVEVANMIHELHMATMTYAMA